MAGAANKRSRGWRLERELADHSDQHPPLQQERPEQSALASRLLNLWSAGHISATALQQLAHAALLDGADHPEVAQLAATGTWGQQPGNVGRDLSRLYLEHIKVASSHRVLVPV